jgi:hypothetical protein
MVGSPAPSYDIAMRFRTVRTAVMAASLVLSLTAAQASKHDPSAPKPDKELAKYAGEYSGETRTKTESLSQSETNDFATKHHTINVSLGADGSATVSQSPNGDDEVTNFGTFKVSGGQITITFDAPPDGKGSTPAPMVLSTGHNELTAVTYDHSLWGKLPPPSMHKGGEMPPAKAGHR